MEMSFIFFLVYLFIIAVVLAVLEIQIEGAHGWAEKLPTWRPGEHNILNRVFRMLAHGKDITGYHLALHIMLFLFFHMPFVFGMYWSWQMELEILSLFTIFFLVWDFLWFVLNPHHSLKDFGPQKIKWHKKWWGRVPVDYPMGVLFGFVLFLPLIYVNPVVYGMKFVLILAVNIVLTLLTILLYPKAY